MTVRRDASRTEAGAVPAPPMPPGTRLPELLRVLQAVRDGDFGERLPGDWDGLEG